MNDAVATLDVRRLLCPIPVIRTQNAVNKMQPGEQLHIVATDPGVMHDIPAWCRIHGHQALSAEKIENEFHLRVQVGNS
jgi:tRNA 2-thiouridine synthesizing protein A